MLKDVPLKALYCILGSSLLFSVMNSLANELSRQLPPTQVATFRVFISLIILFPYLIKRKISIFGSRPALVLARGVAGFLSLCLGFYAMTKIPIAEVSVLWKSSIIFTAILSVFLIKEKVTFKLLAYSSLCFTGAILILKPSYQIINIGGLSALLAGFSVAIVSVSIRKLHQTEHSGTIIFGFNFWGSVLGFLIFGNTFSMPSPQQFILLFASGIFGLLGQVLFTRAFLFAPASVVQAFTFAEVLFTAISGIIFFNQIPDILSVLGGVLIIIAGIGMVTRNTANLPITP